jgi:hypothetical protein
VSRRPFVAAGDLSARTDDASIHADDRNAERARGLFRRAAPEPPERDRGHLPPVAEKANCAPPSGCAPLLAAMGLALPACILVLLVLDRSRGHQEHYERKAALDPSIRD